MQLRLHFDWTWILNLNAALGGGLWETYFHVRVKMLLLLWCIFCVWIIFIKFSFVEKKKQQVSFENKRMQPKHFHSPLATVNQLLLISEPQEIRPLLLRVHHRLLHVLRIYSEMMQFEILFNSHHSKPSVLAKHSLLMFVNHTVLVSSGNYD